MSVLPTLNWLDLHGNPNMGVTAPVVTVLSGTLTPLRRSELMQRYQHFCMAKLTMVGDCMVLSATLSDGTRVRMETMQGRDTVKVWALDAKKPKRPSQAGWSLLPYDQRSYHGYVRRPGRDDSMSPRDFVPAKSDEKSNVFISAKDAKRKVFSTRNGGHSIWRGEGKNPLTLSHDASGVYLDGKRLTLVTSDGKAIELSGVGVASNESGKWIVAVSLIEDTEGVFAGRLPRGDAAQVACVRCGDSRATRSTIFIKNWAFSPDGLHAINIDKKNNIHRMTLTTSSGDSPFTVRVAVAFNSDKPRRVVVARFNPRQAQRNLHWQGWTELSLSLDLKYYAVLEKLIDGGFGPTSLTRGSSQNPVDYVHEHQFAEPSVNDWVVPISIPNVPYDPIMSMNSGEIDHSGLYAPNSVQALAPVRIPKSAFVYSDEFVPDDGVQYSRTFVPDASSSPNTGAGGQWVQSHPANNIARVIAEYPEGRPFPIMLGMARGKKCFLGIILEYRVRWPRTIPFDSLTAAGTYVDAKWSSVGDAQYPPSYWLERYYREVYDKNDYASLTEAAVYLTQQSKNLVENSSKISLVSAQRRINLRQNKIDYFGSADAPTYGDEEYESFRIYRRSQGETYGYEESYTTMDAPVFNAQAALSARASYRNNFTTDWQFDSSLAIAGTFYLAAGYDQQGQEVLLYLRGDASRKAQHSANVSAQDAPRPDATVTFSGGMEAALMLGDVEVDRVRYACTDSFTTTVETHSAYYQRRKGDAALIEINNLVVLDEDMQLGHVLYRKWTETLEPSTPGASPSATKYTLKYRDLLFTRTQTYELGPERDASDHQLPSKVAGFRSTEEIFREANPLLDHSAPRVVLDGVRITPDFVLGGGAPIPPDYKSVSSYLQQTLPVDQRNTARTRLGWNDDKYELDWFTYYLATYWESASSGDTGFLYHRDYTRTDEGVRLSMDSIGIPYRGLSVTAALRSYSDEQWLVAIGYESNLRHADIGTRRSTSRFYVKTDKDSPIQAVESVQAFPFLDASTNKLADLCFSSEVKA